VTGPLELATEHADVYSDEGYYAVIPEWVLDADISALAVRLYAALRRYADQRTMHAHPSRKTLATRLKVKSIRTVDGAIDELKSIGALSTFPRFTPAGDPDSNGYRLHRHPASDAPKHESGPARGGAAGCTTAPDCTTLVQQTAHKPQPLEPQPAPSPTEREGAHAGAHTREADDGPPQLALVAAPAEPVRGKRGKAKRTPAQIPEDWEPSEELWRSTQEDVPGIPRSEVAQFVSRHRSKGDTFVDFDAAWRYWARNWIKFGSKGSTLGGTRASRSQPYRNPPEEPTQESLRAGWESAGTTGGGNW
jgi:hypothetical protein